MQRRVCPDPRLDDVTVVTPVPGQVMNGPGTYTLRLTGTNFVPWQPHAAGTQVSVQRAGITGWEDDPDFDVIKVEWVDLDELIVTVVAHPGVEVGERLIKVINPVEYPEKQAIRGGIRVE